MLSSPKREKRKINKGGKKGQAGPRSRTGVGRGISYGFTRISLTKSSNRLWEGIALGQPRHSVQVRVCGLG